MPAPFVIRQGKSVYEKCNCNCGCERYYDIDTGAEVNVEVMSLQELVDKCLVECKIIKNND